jgi:hypothetical protein
VNITAVMNVLNARSAAHVNVNTAIAKKKKPKELIDAHRAQKF